MRAAVISLDARRPRVHEVMVCLFCRTEHTLVHPVSTALNKYHGPCPGCDEEASLPKWQLEMR